MTRNRRGARWIVYATGWGHATIRRADVAAPVDAIPVGTFRAPSGDIGGTPSLPAVRRLRSLCIEVSR